MTKPTQRLPTGIINHDTVRTHLLTEEVAGSEIAQSEANLDSMHWSKARPVPVEWQEVPLSPVSSSLLRQYHPDDYELVEVEYSVFNECYSKEEEMKSSGEIKKDTNDIEKNDVKSMKESVGDEHLSSSSTSNETPTSNNDSCTIVNMQTKKSKIWKLKDDSTSMLDQHQQYSVLAIAPSESNYAALGDSMGYVTIFCTASITLPINRLVTRASKRQSVLDEAKQYKDVKKTTEIEKYIMSMHNGINMQRGTKGASRVMFASNANVIEALAFAYDSRAIIVATKFEIELLDLSETNGSFGKSIWCIDHIESYRQNESASSIFGKILKISTHPNKAGGILLGLHCFEKPSSSFDVDSYPLVICDAQGKSHHVKLRDAEGVSIKIGSKAVAIWGKFCSTDYVYVSCTTIVSTDDGDNRHEILAVDAETYEVCHRATLSHGLWNNKQTKTVEVINMHPNGKYVLAASFRGGIRMFETLNLALIATFAEGFSLHGKSIQWQDCYFADIPVYGTRHVKSLTSYVVGIPHAFREPMEMIDKIHFWNIDCYEKKLPTLTMQGPNPDIGTFSVQFIEANQSRNASSFLALDTLGQCHELKEGFTTNFAGVMYPPGYTIINNNIEYIEDEDEVDYNEHSEDEVQANLAYYDQTGNTFSELPDNVIIDILPESSSPNIIVCTPQRYLQYDVYESQHLTEAASTQRHVQQNNIFSLLPNCDHLISKKRVDNSMPSSKTGMPRALNFKARNGIEALIKSSMIPRLHDEMVSKEAWSDGRGSSVSADIVIQSCLACRGRFVIHSCGKRTLPIDHDQEATKATEKLEREKEAARQRRLEKNRERDRQRRAERKRKKEEASRQALVEDANNSKKLKPDTSSYSNETMMSAVIKNEVEIANGDKVITVTHSTGPSTSTSQMTKDILSSNQIVIEAASDCSKDKSENSDTQVGLRLELLAKLKAAKMDDDERLRVETAQEKREKILRTKRERERLRREAKKVEKKRQEALRLLRIVQGEISESPPTPTNFPVPPDNADSADPSKLSSQLPSPKVVQELVSLPPPPQVSHQPTFTQPIVNNGVSQWGIDHASSSALALMGFPTQFGPIIPAMIPLMNSVAGNPYIFPSAGFLPFSNAALTSGINPVHVNLAPAPTIENNSAQNNATQKVNEVKLPTECPPPVANVASSNNEHEEKVSSKPSASVSASNSDHDAAISMLELNATPYSDMLHGKSPE